MNNLQLDHSQHHQCISRKYPLCFLAHNMNVPMNIGSLFRIADALGIEKIYLTGKSLTPPNAKIRKTSRSTEKYVSYSYTREPLDVVSDLKKSGYQIISLEMTTSSIDLEELSVDKSSKVCLMLGAENDGVSQELLDASDQTVHIPMLGVNSSMNVATACSIAAYEIIRKLHDKQETETRRTIQERK